MYHTKYKIIIQEILIAMHHPDERCAIRKKQNILYACNQPKRQIPSTLPLDGKSIH